MASCTRVALSLGLVGLLFALMVSFDHLDMLKVKTGRIHQVQEQRKQQLREMCDSVKKDFPQWDRNLEDLRGGPLANFLVNDKHGVIYCYIPKVACTTWKRFMIVLGNGEPYRDPMSFKEVHENPMIKYLNRNPRAELKAKLKHYTKFLFVRDPFVRLISAYRNKFLQYRKPFYDRYGRLMLRRYGNQSNPPLRTEEVLASGVHPSFSHFVKFLLDPKTERPLNEHWNQMYKLCHPCLIQYDFIGHQETLQEDSEYLLNTLKLFNDIKLPPAYQNVTTQDFLSSFFKSVPVEERRRLYQMYEMDFKLFGFPKPVELLEG